MQRKNTKLFQYVDKRASLTILGTNQFIIDRTKNVFHFSHD